MDWLKRNCAGRIRKACLAGGIPTPLKNMSSSVGMILPNIWKVIKFIFQTTNQNNPCGCLQKRLLRVDFKHQSSMVGCLTDRWRTKDDLKELWFHHLYILTTNEPCSKCLTSWHQIRKCLRHCLRLAYAHQSFAYATPLQGAPCLTWTQGFRRWLKSGFYDVTKCLIHVYIAFEVKTTWNGHGTNKIKDMFWPTDSLPSHKSTSGSLGWGGVGWDNNVIGISTWTWCYALWPSIAIPHELDATLYDLQLQFRTSASDSRGWGGVGWGGDNTVIFISTWTWCYALRSSLAFPHDLDATLYDLHWHFHMNLMLRSMTFNCNSTWAWCYALWSSIALPHIRIR